MRLAQPNIRQWRLPAAGLTFLLVVAQASSSSSQNAVDDRHLQQLDGYLAERQLYLLQISLWESRLEAAVESTQRLTVAQRLIELYTAMMQGEDATGQERAKLRNGIQRLLVEFPSLETEQVDLAIALGKYRQAKEDFERWIWNRRDRELRESVRAALTEIWEQTGKAEGRLAKGEGVDLAQQPRLPNQNDLDTAERIAQIRYLRGWTAYYLGIVIEPSFEREEFLRASVEQFRRLLQIPDGQSVLELTPGWFSLKSESICRTVLGLSMASAALHRDRDAEHGFRILAAPPAPVAIRDQLSVWQFHARLFPGRLDKMNQLARSWIEDPSSFRGNPAAVWSTVYLAGATWVERPLDPADTLSVNSLIVDGLTGLAFENQWPVIDQLTRDYPVTVHGSGFFAAWFQGYLRLHLGKSELPRVIASLRQALSDPTEVSPVHRARCAYHLGFALFRDGQYEAAAETIAPFEATLRHADPQTAASAMWVRCQALQKLALLDPTRTGMFEAIATSLQRHFPDSEIASQSEFLQQLHRVSGMTPLEGIAELSLVGPSQTHYRRARFEICLLWYQAWTDTDGNATNRDGSLAAEALASMEALFDVVPPEDMENRARMARISVLACEIAQSQEARQGLAKSWLDRCRSMKVDIEKDADLNSRFRFLVMKDEVEGSSQRLEHATWIAEHSAFDEHRIAALIELAEDIDRRLSVDEDSRASGLLSEATEIYRQLISLLRKNRADIGRNANLRVSIARLGQYEMKAGQFDRAQRLFQELLDEFPREQSYIQWLARAHAAGGQYGAAAGLWRKVVAGSTPGSDDWLDAKYQLIGCLAVASPDLARQVLRQTLTLAPKMPADWHQRFRQLRDQLNDPTMKR